MQLYVLVSSPLLAAFSKTALVCTERCEMPPGLLLGLEITCLVIFAADLVLGFIAKCVQPSAVIVYSRIVNSAAQHIVLRSAHSPL